MRFIAFTEPKIQFRHGQELEDPRDGLTLFGPLDEAATYGIRAGVVGTPAGIERYVRYVERIQRPIFLTDQKYKYSRPMFPGFEAAFRVPWKPQPTLAVTIEEAKLTRLLHIEDRYQRVFSVVGVFADAIVKASKNEDAGVDLWFVVIPDDVYKYCRPQSNVEKELKVVAEGSMKLSTAKKLQVQPSLFQKMNEDAEPYKFEPNFHHQLKGRLLSLKLPVQIVRESTIAHQDFLNSGGRPKRDLDKLQTAIAWHISTAAFYKAGGKPWKMAQVRDGVCYLGLVFKHDEKQADPRVACCAAQMFLDSGDGIVFRGAVGPWYNPKRGDFHLSASAAKELVSMAVEAYKSKHNAPPKELFIHGRVNFSDEEWEGFRAGVTAETNLVGVKIYTENRVRFFASESKPVLRGTALMIDGKSAHLFSGGFIPRIRTYPGREVPRPLLVQIVRGDTDLSVVLKDILALTKLNYNACIHSDHTPVTLRFADAVGEVLTSGIDLKDSPPLPFKFYI